MIVVVEKFVYIIAIVALGCIACRDTRVKDDGQIKPPNCPQVNCPAESCDSTNCQLPNCYCSSTEPPSGMSIEDMPQIVAISFDSPLTEILYSTYFTQFFDFKNPNDCEIGINYILTHEYNDYQITHDVWSHGHEVVPRSISDSSQQCVLQLTHQQYIDEIVGMRQMISTYANMSYEDITGARAPCPYNMDCGDSLFQVLTEYNFTYDVSMSTQKYTNPPIFPYTLDYRSLLWCPVDSYSGFWEVPNVVFNDTTNIPCYTLDSCPSTNTTNSTFDFLMQNFLNHYTTNKAPFQIITHPSWMETDPSHWPGLLSFIQYLNGLSDVYIVTLSKALAWMKQPTALADLGSFEPWACTKHDNICSPKNDCYYESSTPGGSRIMNVCGSCPPHYPWVGDPFGSNTTTD